MHGTMELFKNIFVLLHICLMYNELGQSKKIEDILTCLNDTECNELEDVETYTEVSRKEESTQLVETSAGTEGNFDISNNTDFIDVTTQTTKDSRVLTTVSPPKAVQHQNETKRKILRKKQSKVCNCDLTVLSCDINCCCDKDCSEFQLEVFSYCDESHIELYDSRYCYNTDFIERNNTPFILEKLATNLFCILYDNLPPKYTANNGLVIRTQEDFKKAVNPEKLTWKWTDRISVPEYNVSHRYQDGDVIWKLDNSYIQPLEVLQTGFTGLCTFKKTLIYLRGLKESCLQTKLDDTNKQLFPSAFNNFTIISSPHLFNGTKLKLSKQECPRNVCLSLTSHYCENSWHTCRKTYPLGSCTNGKCHNIVIGVRYLIVHNGTMGINNTQVYYKIGNVSTHFYQHFEVIYQWVDVNGNESFALSGNPGYIYGKPIIIGTSNVNKTNNAEVRYITFNRTNAFLTLPLAQRNRECSESNRHVVAFGEDIKIKCSVSVHTNNLSTSSCAEVQNRTMYFLMKDSLFNVTETAQYNIYISKSGNITERNTADWVQILLDRVPRNTSRGEIINNQLHCLGLVTSMHLNILYSTTQSTDSFSHYDILGTSLTFSNESDIFWSRCVAENCTDTLNVDITSYVTFHDVSKPSKFYFVGGPQLDIILPHDFFYPFLSTSMSITPSIYLLSIVALEMISDQLF